MDMLNTQKKVDRVNNFGKLNREKLDKMTAKQLLNLIERSWSHVFSNAMAHNLAEPTWEEIYKIRIEIAKTIWRNFPEVAERKGLNKKFK